MACRWRTKKEVLLGKGEIVCGNKTCAAERSLEDYEFAFGYAEAGQQKTALVKVRLCKNCEQKMRYKAYNNLYLSGNIK